MIQVNNVALYRSWRPRKFDDVVGQEHVTLTLKNAIAQNRLAHAYLFCGTRGTGKTSTALILSRAVNCLAPTDGEPCNECEVCRGISDGSIMDVVEIDAASNNSVDDIRRLRDGILYAPTIAKRKVYVIDEVHMLSGGAFNALLKTIEEPPPFVLFALATTEPHKLPATIISRCQRFDFRRITEAAVEDRLERIATDCGARAEPGALALIARLADGSMRDGISILDQCLQSLPSGGAADGMAGGASPILTRDAVARVAGVADDRILADGARIMAAANALAVPKYVADVSFAGVEIGRCVGDLIGFMRTILLVKLGQDDGAFPELSPASLADIRQIAGSRDLDWIFAAIGDLTALAGFLKSASGANPTTMLEITMAKICVGAYQSPDSVSALGARIDALERLVGSAASGAAVSHTQPPAPRQPSTPQPAAQIVDLRSPPPQQPQPQQPQQPQPQQPQQPQQSWSPKQQSQLQSQQLPPPLPQPQLQQPQPWQPQLPPPLTPQQQTPPAVGSVPRHPAQSVSNPPPSARQADAPIDAQLWKSAVSRLKEAGEPILFAYLMESVACLRGGDLIITLSQKSAPHARALGSHANLSKLSQALSPSLAPLIQARTLSNVRVQAPTASTPATTTPAQHTQNAEPVYAAPAPYAAPHDPAIPTASPLPSTPAAPSAPAVLYAPTVPAAPSAPDPSAAHDISSAASAASAAPAASAVLESQALPAAPASGGAPNQTLLNIAKSLREKGIDTVVRP